MLPCFLSLSLPWCWNWFAENQHGWIITVWPTCLNALSIYITKTFLVTFCPCLQVDSRFIRSLGRLLHPLSQRKVAFRILSGQKTTEGIILFWPSWKPHTLPSQTSQEILLPPVFLSNLMQTKDNTSRPFLLFKEQSGLRAQHPPCLISTSQSRLILGITWFLSWMGKKIRSSIFRWNMVFGV